VESRKKSINTYHSYNYALIIFFYVLYSRKIIPLLKWKKNSLLLFAFFCQFLLLEPSSRSGSSYSARSSRCDWFLVRWLGLPNYLQPQSWWDWGLVLICGLVMSRNTHEDPGQNQNTLPATWMAATSENDFGSIKPAPNAAVKLIWLLLVWRVAGKAFSKRACGFPEAQPDQWDAWFKWFLRKIEENWIKNFAKIYGHLMGWLRMKIRNFMEYLPAKPEGECNFSSNLAVRWLETRTTCRRWLL